MDAKKKFFLLKQSKHFCAVPWNHFKIHTDGKVYTCVNGQTLLGDSTQSPITEILANPLLCGMRDNLRQDLPDTNCAQCYKQEGTGNSSYKFLRDLYNPMFVKSTADYDTDELVLNAVDLHWSSTCNLKCITCWGEQSSAIAQELGEPIRHTPTEAAENAIDFIVANQYNLKELYMSGGEPTLIKHNLNLLRRLRKDLDFTIRINTNRTFNDANPIIEELKSFPKVLFTISADSMGDRFNYIRRGADWGQFLSNLDKLKKLHFDWRVNSVFFVASAYGLSDTQEFFMKNYDITDFTINQVGMDHTSIRCRNLSDDTKAAVVTKLLDHQAKYKNNNNLHGQLDNCLKELAVDASESYVPFFEDVDSRAGTDWKKVFTEL